MIYQSNDTYTVTSKCEIGIVIKHPHTAAATTIPIVAPIGKPPVDVGTGGSIGSVGIYGTSNFF